MAVMTLDDLYIKANFTKFVNKFERENGSLVDFGSELTMDSKINIIYNTFLNYVKDETEERENDSAESAPEQGVPSSD